jgi:hypothetical protein
VYFKISRMTETTSFMMGIWGEITFSTRFTNFLLC